MFNSCLDFAEIQAAGEKNAAYICYYTTKLARKPVTYVTDSVMVSAWFSALACPAVTLTSATMRTQQNSCESAKVVI